MKKIMLHSNGTEKKVKVGFSWTTFFFGWIPSACRGDLISALKLFFLGIITLRIYPIVKCFSINRDYEKHLKLKGFKEGGVVNEGFPEIKVLEYIVTVIEITMATLVIVIFVTLFTSIFSKNKNVQASTHGIKTESILEYFFDELDDQHHTVDIPLESSSLKSAKKDMYKTDIDTKKINKQLKDIDKQIATIYINYGKEIKTTRGVPKVMQENQESLELLKHYHRDINKILNEQWGVLKEILTPEAFKKLQVEQIKWVNQKDEDAKSAENNSDTELGKDILYYSSLGSDAYYRIAELDKIYL